MELYGQSFSRRDLEAYSGDLRQFADIRLVTLDDGLERGVRAALVRTGSGLDFSVLLDRAMDIGTATYRGIPLAWQSGTGAAHPSRYDPHGVGWLHTFHGGLLSLCGLTQVGRGEYSDPETGEEIPLHGRINTLPAYDIGVERDWEAGVLRLHGTVDETVLFGYKLRLQRTLEIPIGGTEIRLHDRVRNLGGEAAPLMILYHCNLGFPVVAPESAMTSLAAHVRPRDAEAETGGDNWSRMYAPTAGFREQVFFHDLDRSAQQVVAGMHNPRLGIGVEFVFNPQQLSYLTQWKQLGFGDYVVGIEPANCVPEGRVVARENGRLRMLPPGETDEFMLTIRITGDKR